MTADSLSIDSEYQLFRVLPTSLSSRIERSVYNCRRRKLFFIKERIRKAMSDKLTGTENYFIVDSMPLEICKLSRSSRTTICKEDYPAHRSVKNFALDAGRTSPDYYLWKLKLRFKYYI